MESKKFQAALRLLKELEPESADDWEPEELYRHLWEEWWREWNGILQEWVPAEGDWKDYGNWQT